MATIKEELVYAAVSSNRNENNISCQDRYLLYSKCRCPIVYNLDYKLVAAILIGHTAEVNGQCFVDSEDDATNRDDPAFYVISTAHDKSAILWKVCKDATLSSQSKKQYEIVYRIESPDESVFMTRSSLKTRAGIFITVLTSMNGNIYLYQSDQLKQTITTRDCYFDSKFYLTNYRKQDSTQERPLTSVALAGSDNKVHLFQLVSNEINLNPLLDLSGFNDWIKCLAFYTLPDRDNEFLLAAACQDSLIQVWHLRLTDLTISEATRVRTKVSRPIWDDGSDIKVTATLETVLSGHVGFVHGLCWFKNMAAKDQSNRLQLISCSSDRTVIIWRSAIAKSVSEIALSSNEYESYPASEGVWQELRRLGETGEVNLPFLGVCLSPEESTLYAQSLRGAIHSWSLGKECEYQDWWAASETITGHFDSVTDLAWERTGAYLLSSSNDKTCRLHAIAASDNKWHELSRPQVHGYEVNCVASLNFSKFASGAEEKTIRTFEVTKFFIKNFKALAKRQIPGYCREDLETALYDELPAHAQLPALGLSNRGSQCPFDVNEEDKTATIGSKINKATASSAQQQLQPQSGDSGASKLSDNNSWQEVSDLIHKLSTIDHLESPPYEEVLLLSTLWWEKNKLFGHCNELHALACDSTGSFLASASKANRADLASVIVWETDKFRKVATIEHHTLTITRIRFSPDDRYLLSVSRDRTWCLCERNPNGQLRNAYRRLVGTVKTNAVHERIIWDCCWTHDSKYFLTVSRDKKAILWSVDSLRAQISNDSSPAPAESAPIMNLNYVTSSTFKSSIQAVDSTREATQAIANNSLQYLFVLGFEDGSIELYNLHQTISSTPCPDWQWQLMATIPNLHQLSVRRLAFQPLQSDRGGGSSRHVIDSTEPPNQDKLLLASGGDDCMVRLTRLTISRVCVGDGGV